MPSTSRFVLSLSFCPSSKQANSRLFVVVQLTSGGRFAKRWHRPWSPLKRLEGNELRRQLRRRPDRHGPRTYILRLRIGNRAVVDILPRDISSPSKQSGNQVSPGSSNAGQASWDKLKRLFARHSHTAASLLLLRFPKHASSDWDRPSIPHLLS